MRGSALQISCPGVIPESGPKPHELLFRSLCERFCRRESFQKPLVIGDHRGYLRLLQHDFGYKPLIGCIKSLPRQRASAA